MRVAIYARYSSDNQREASIADQLRICRLRAEQEGWQIVEKYTDHAVSGASLLRPGIQALMSDAGRGRFGLICAEASLQAAPPRGSMPRSVRHSLRRSRHRV